MHRERYSVDAEHSNASQARACPSFENTLRLSVSGLMRAVPAATLTVSGAMRAWFGAMLAVFGATVVQTGYLGNETDWDLR
jgi:hypothetical protein